MPAASKSERRARKLPVQMRSPMRKNNQKNKFNMTSRFIMKKRGTSKTETEIDIQLVMLVNVKGVRAT